MMLLRTLGMLATSFSPSGYIEKLVTANPCVVFGDSYGVHTVMVKHQLIKSGAKCETVDVDRFKPRRRKKLMSAVKLLNMFDDNSDKTKDGMPVVFLKGQAIGGSAEVFHLAGTGQLPGMLAKAGAVMLDCMGQKRYSKVLIGGSTSAMNEGAYVKDLIQSGPCVLFANTWCADDKQDAIKTDCTPYSADIENSILRAGGKCQVIDLWKDKMNKGFFKVLSPESYQNKDFTFESARFGHPLPQGGEQMLVEAKPDIACQPLTNELAVQGKVVLVDRGSCTFVQKMKMVEAAGGVGMVVVNTEDKLVALDGAYKGKIWAISMSVSAGQLLKDAIHSKAGYASIYLEKGGRVQQELDKLAGKKMKLPMLYVGGKTIGGEVAVQDASTKHHLGSALKSANAFAHTPNCHGVGSTTVIKIHHKHGG